MLFNSYSFLVFFSVVTLLFFLLPHKFRWSHLLLASVFFYAAFLPLYILILAITIGIDYIAGIMIEPARGNKRRAFLILSIVANIGFLALFKYYDFIVFNLNHFLHLHIPLLDKLRLSQYVVAANNQLNTSINNVLGTHLDVIKNIVLPIGLSFHTFQAMSYTIEVYRGNQKAERHLGIYALYVMFYPQLVAGPIERPQHMLHQFREKKSFSSENLITGLRLMIWGLFKKVVIADRLSVYVDIVFHKPESYHWLNVLLAVLFFSIQIYCDFSGYTDMAIGAAKTMGFDLMQNFKRPYFATNIKDFWSRWHISLTSWFRDYVYISMGGNKVKLPRYVFNIAVVFLLSGLWHGANITFLLWGALHALYYLGYILFKRLLPALNTKTYLWKVGGWLLTFTSVSFAWIFFRAKDAAQAFGIINQILNFNSNHAFNMALKFDTLGFGWGSLVVGFCALVYMLWIESIYEPQMLSLNNKPKQDLVFLILTTTIVIVFGMFVREQFIYFQF
ncbi:MAG: MBOAT family protein [Bacteroidetes bacterium]|nr:MBOAT family protein [Bacteroidota bacterium]